jgi:hypothetical protein
VSKVTKKFVAYRIRVFKIRKIIGTGKKQDFHIIYRQTIEVNISKYSANKFFISLKGLEISVSFFFSPGHWVPVGTGIHYKKNIF